MTKSEMVAPPICETKPVTNSPKNNLNQQKKLVTLTKTVYRVRPGCRRQCLRGPCRLPGRAGLRWPRFYSWPGTRWGPAGASGCLEMGWTGSNGGSGDRRRDGGGLQVGLSGGITGPDGLATNF